MLFVVVVAAAALAMLILLKVWLLQVLKKSQKFLQAENIYVVATELEEKLLIFYTGEALHHGIEAD